MARWWTQPPIIIAFLGVLAVILTALLPRTTITQQTSGSGSPAVGSTGHDVMVTQQPTPPAAGPSPAPLPSPLSSPPAGQSWWQQPPVIAALIAALATLVAALIQHGRATSPTEPQTRRPRRQS